MIKQHATGVPKKESYEKSKKKILIQTKMEIQNTKICGMLLKQL